MVHSRELEIVVYGDPRRVYRPGDKVEGMVFFLPNTQQHIRSLTLDFTGICATRTTRPQYARTSDGRPPVLEGLKNFEGEATLFKYGRLILADCDVAAKKHSWPFEFTFPSQTQNQCPKWVDSPKFSIDAHQLPPSFHVYTNEPGGEGKITYSVTAKLFYGRWQHKSKKLAQHRLRFFNDAKFTLHTITPVLKLHLLKEQRWSSTILRPAKHTLKQKLEHVITQTPSLCTPTISLVPSIRCPEAVSPQQNIPLILSLQHIRRHPAVDPENIDCNLQSLTVSITTFNRTICEGGVQDVMEQRRQCVTRRDINTPLPLDGSPFSLVSNLRLNDNAECIASFATFTIARYYTLDVEMVLTCGPKSFTVNSSTPLEILPGAFLSRPAAVDEQRASFEQLPAYEPRPMLPGYSESMESTVTLGSSALSVGDQAFENESLHDEVSTPLTPPITPALDDRARPQW